MASSSSATVRVEKATSEFLIGPDWALNIDICDTLNANRMLAKDVVKAVKKRIQHKNPNVQLLALTLLETMVKNCGDYIHFQIAERNVLQEMVKIVKKKADMRVRDKIVTLIGSWHEAFGGAGGKYPQYYVAYEDLRRLGVEFPRRPPEAAPIYTPPVIEPISRQPPPPGYPISRQYPQPGYPISGHPQGPQPSYGMPSSSSTRLDEAMAAEGNLSLSSINSMRNVLDLLNDMLQAVDPSDRSTVKDEVIVDLVEQCRANQRKLMQSLATTGDEELLGVGLDLNDCLQIALAKHDAIASGSPLPPEVTNITSRASEKPDSSPKSAGVSTPNATSNGNNTPSAPVVPPQRGLIDEEEEEDEFALLARRHSKPRADASPNTSTVKSDVAPSEVPSSPAMNNALVPLNNPPPPVRTKDQDIIDLLSMTLYTPPTEPTSQVPPSPMQTPSHIPSTSQAITFSSEASPGRPGLAFNSYIAPWARAQPQPQSPFQSQNSHFQPQPQPQPQPQSPFQSHYSHFQAQPQPQTPLQSHNSHFHTQAQPQPQPQSPLPPHNSHFQAQPQPQSPLQSHSSHFQPQPQPQPASQPQSPSPSQPQQFQSQPDVERQPDRDPQNQPEYQFPTEPTFHAPRPQPESPQYAASSFPPPPWAATPGYFSNQNPMFRQPYTHSSPRALQNESINGELLVNSSPRSPAVNAGQKPFIPSYRLFDDLNVLGNMDGRFKAKGNGSPSFSGSNNQSMVGGRKL